MKRKRELIDDILDPNYNLEDIDYDYNPDAHYSDSDIKIKYLRCGFEENVSDFIYDEFAKKQKRFRIFSKSLFYLDLPFVSLVI